MIQRLCDYIVEKQDDIWGFISGNIVTTCIVLQFDFFTSVIKLSGVLLIGIMGGFGGLLGKKIFTQIDNWLEKKISKK